MSTPVCLDSRVVLRIDGEDAEVFLNGLLTNSILNMQDGDVRYAALLMPQGKIICDMLVVKAGTSFLLDVPVQADESLAKRLNMFRLKADVSISIADDLAVYAFIEDGFIDPRHNDMPKRKIDKKNAWENTSRRAYDIERIKLSVPEQGKDFGENEVFPADINMEMLNGVDFKKGCFVGQEVVSRMKRRGTARRRTLAFHFPNGSPDADTPFKLGETILGEISSSTTDYALVRLRLDRLVKAQSNDELDFEAGGKKAHLIEPKWLAEQLEAMTSS